MLVQVVQDDLGDRVALEHDDQALARTTRGLVTDVRDALDLAVLDQVRDAQRQVVGVDLVGELGDDEADPVLDLLDVDDRAHGDGSTTRAVRLLDALVAEDRRAGREVRALDLGQQDLEELLLGGLRVLEVPLHAVRDLTEVVRGDVRRHADRDTGRAVDQQVREPRGQDDGFLGTAVVVVLEVDGLLVDVPDHLRGQRRHAALGVSRGRGRVVARRPEVPLAGSERVAQRPVLDQADQGVVDRRVTVRVELSHDVTDDTAALGERTVGAVAAVVHRVQHATVDGLEAVTHVRQRTAHDDAHRVVEVRALHLELQVHLCDPAVLHRDRAVGPQRRLGPVPGKGPLVLVLLGSLVRHRRLPRPVVVLLCGEAVVTARRKRARSTVKVPGPVVRRAVAR